MSLVRLIIRTKFRLTSPAKALATVTDETDKTLAIAKALGTELCARQIRVPKMVGVDEDMREWSILQIAEHNTIVTRQMTRVVTSLVTGEELTGNFNPKTDVMPGESPSDSILEDFRKSSADHLAAITAFGDTPLKGTPTRKHPVFADLDAHGWHCMCGFHLGLHRKQAETLAKLLQ